MPSLGWDRFVFVRAAKCPAPCSLTEELTPFTTKDETHLRRPFKPLHVPPEILVEIFGAVPHDFFTEAEGRLLCRDRALVTFALVSRSWNDAAYLVLYGDLRLALGRTREAKFRRTFQANQRLIPLVHKCSVRLVTDEQWDEDYLSSDAGEPLVDKSHAHWPWTEEGEPGPDDEERLAWIRSAVLSKRLWSKDDGFISGSRGRQRGCLSLLQIIAPFLATVSTPRHTSRVLLTDPARRAAPPCICSTSTALLTIVSWRRIQRS